MHHCMRLRMSHTSAWLVRQVGKCRVSPAVDVGEEPPAEELVGALAALRRVAVGARVVALADAPVERALAALEGGARVPGAARSSASGMPFEAILTSIVRSRLAALSTGSAVPVVSGPCTARKSSIAITRRYGATYRG